MENITFREAQDMTDELIQELGGYWPPFAMLASVMEEVGELAREINALEQIKKKKPSEKKNELGEELADTIYSLICIANHYQIDLGDQFQKIVQKYRERDQNRF
jgi:NTP pyrophosphatase (non-canonical NTP hydrolase)